MSLYDRMEAVMVVRGLSPRTRAAYHRRVELLVAFHDDPVGGIGSDEVMRYFLHLRALGRAPATLAVSWAAFKLLFDSVLQRPEVMNTVPRPRSKKRAPIPAPTREEVRALVAAAGNRYQRTVMLVLYGTGLRLSELRQLRAEDLDTRTQLIHIRSGKGDKARTVHLSESLLRTFRDHWAYHQLPGPLLFPTALTCAERAHGARFAWRDWPVGASTIQRWFQRAGARADLKRKFTPHDMRRAYGTQLLEAGVDLRQVQVLLGHSDPRTTIRYLSVSAALVRRTPCPLEMLGA